uniref:uncharacterized protein LOC122587933 n=1 Tax=Erigeron canadensis TaxID=72917 RepID=UPI001CB9AA91|nr:uncharacterized protein LOC122587933 [Erigeron canadensis]
MSLEGVIVESLTRKVGAEHGVEVHVERAIYAELPTIRTIGACQQGEDQLDLTLGYLDLDYAIRNDEPAAITTNSTAEQKAAFEKWDKANRLSLMTVKNSIPLGLRGAIPESDKVKDYLKSVEDYFKGSSKAHASSLMLKMLTLKYDGSNGVREDIMKMSDMANKLKTLEMEVSDNFLVHFIMTSLPA